MIAKKDTNKISFNIKNRINYKFICIFNELKDAGLIKSNIDFAKICNTSPQKITEILKERLNVGTDIIYYLYKKFNIDPKLLFDVSDDDYENHKELNCLAEGYVDYSKKELQLLDFYKKENLLLKNLLSEKDKVIHLLESKDYKVK